MSKPAISRWFQVRCHWQVNGIWYSPRHKWPSCFGSFAFASCLRISANDWSVTKSCLPGAYLSFIQPCQLLILRFGIWLSHVHASSLLRTTLHSCLSLYLRLFIGISQTTLV